MPVSSSAKKPFKAHTSSTYIQECLKGKGQTRNESGCLRKWRGRGFSEEEGLLSSETQSTCTIDFNKYPVTFCKT